MLMGREKAHIVLGSQFYYWNDYTSSYHQAGINGRIMAHYVYCNDFSGRG